MCSYIIIWDLSLNCMCQWYYEWSNGILNEDDNTTEIVNIEDVDVETDGKLGNVPLTKLA